MKKLIWIGIAGMAGAIARVGIGQLVYSESGFPIATLAVNIVGTFLLCFIVTGACRKLRAHKQLQDAVTTGFLGSITTFSALSMEFVLLMETGHFMLAALYMGSSVVGGLVAGAFGFYLGEKRVKP